MRYRLIYEELGEGAAQARELIVEAADEGSAYDQGMAQMTETERLVGVIETQD